MQRKRWKTEVADGRKTVSARCIGAKEGGEDRRTAANDAGGQFGYT